MLSVDAAWPRFLLNDTGSRLPMPPSAVCGNTSSASCYLGNEILYAPALSWHRMRLCASPTNRAAAYRLVLTRFVMPASFALFKAAIRNWPPRRSPGVSHAETVLDLLTRWYPGCRWPRR